MSQTRPRDPQALPVAALTLALVLLALWRVRFGVDHGDGGHVVAIAVRMARGDLPLVDEMNLQALGSLLAVPFTWVWLQLVGTEGIVLASRVFYLGLALGAGAIGYLALRTGLRPLIAFVGVVLACTPTAYNLLVTSYNTVPLLALSTAVFAGYAALSRGSARWGAVTGVALALSGLSHPASLPAAIILGLLVLALGVQRDRGPGRAVRGLLVGGLAVSAVIVLWVLLVLGPASLRETLRYTTEYQGLRPPPVDRLVDTASSYVQLLLTWSYLPVTALAVLACLPRLDPRWRALAATAVPLAIALMLLRRTLAAPGEVFVGVMSGSYATIVALFLLVPVTLWVVREDTELRLLLLLALPTAVVGLVTYSLMTSAGAAWGATSPPAMALYGVLGMAVTAMVRRSWRSSAALVAAAAVVLGSLGLTHVQRQFRDPAVWETHAEITHGPHAGLVTTDHWVVSDCGWRSQTAAWIAPGESLLAYQAPAAYLYTEGPMDTNIIWLAQFGRANQHTLDWMDRTGRRPDVVVVHPAAWKRWEELREEDPLVAMLDEDYGQPVDAGQFVVLRRDGATTPPQPMAAPVGC